MADDGLTKVEAPAIKPTPQASDGLTLKSTGSAAPTDGLTPAKQPSFLETHVEAPAKKTAADIWANFRAATQSGQDTGKAYEDWIGGTPGKVAGAVAGTVQTGISDVGAVFQSAVDAAKEFAMANGMSETHANQLERDLNTGVQESFGRMGGMSPVAEASVAKIVEESGAPAGTVEIFKDAATEVSGTPKPKIALEPEAESVGNLKRGEYNYNITKDGEYVGSVYVTMRPDGTLSIDNVAVASDQGKPGSRLGPAGVRQLYATLKEKFPAAKTITGARTTGARAAVGVPGQVSVPIKAERKTLSDFLSSESGAIKPPLPPTTEPVPPPPIDVPKYVGDIEDRMYKVRNETTAGRIGTLKMAENAISQVPDAATREKLIHYQEQPSKTELTPQEKQAFDQTILPMIKQREAVDAKTAALVGETHAPAWPENIPGKSFAYAPKYVASKGSTIDWLTRQIGKGLGSRSLSTTGGFLKKRSIETPMIENPKVPYYKDAVVNNAVRLEEANRRLRNVQLLNDLKDDPRFSEVARKVVGEMPPEGWHKVNLPFTFLQDYYFHPKVANAINDFYKDYSRSDDSNQFLTNINRMVIGTMFYSPWSHAANVFNDWLVSKGALGMIKELAQPTQMAKRVSKAWSDVATLNDDYVKDLRAGSAMQYGEVKTENFYKFLTDNLNAEIKRNPQPWNELAQVMGYASGAKLLEPLYRNSRKALWFFGDFLKREQVMALQEKGLSHADAIKEAENHMVNYRIPSEVLGSHVLSSYMKNPLFMMFGRYHYGILKSLFRTLAGAAKGNPRELDSLAMIGLVYAGYLGADKVVQEVLGNKNAYVRRYGLFGLIDVIVQMLEGQKDPRDVALRVASPSPYLTATAEGLYGKNPYTGQDIIRGRDVYQHPSRFAKEIGGLVGGQVYPIQQGARVLEGKIDPMQLLLSQLGIYSPTDQQVQKKKKGRKIGDQRLQKQLRKTFGN